MPVTQRPRWDNLVGKPNTVAGFGITDMNTQSVQSAQYAVVGGNGAWSWVNFNGTGTVAIRGASNITSVTDNGVGDYTVNIASALPDVNYAVLGSNGFAGNPYNNFFVGTRTTTSVQVKTYNSYALGAADCDPVCVGIFR